MFVKCTAQGAAVVTLNCGKCGKSLILTAKTNDTIKALHMAGKEAAARGWTFENTEREFCPKCGGK